MVGLPVGLVVGIPVCLVVDIPAGLVVGIPVGLPVGRVGFTVNRYGIIGWTKLLKEHRIRRQ